jgi:hypothetical protein
MPLPTYLQLERIEKSLRMPLDDIGDDVHALVRCLLDHVVAALVRDPEIAKTFRPHDLRVVVADAHFECVDEIIRHGFLSDNPKKGEPGPQEAR